ncbi:MAG: hypothetical protein KKE44_19120 [Proteobacteria bacterium]|nr:hypothetical protein [Pseudomonadota bacterium]MBU1584846.1 hypothetical protein [Pseudomonadota bacterium]MBU2629542.1 hypothetical protein [Pseudomonadota bacterium]
MRYIINIISVCCLLFLVGCSQVISKYPIGIENYIASSDALDGLWLSEDDFIKIKVIENDCGKYFDMENPVVLMKFKK